MGVLNYCFMYPCLCLTETKQMASFESPDYLGDWLYTHIVEGLSAHSKRRVLCPWIVRITSRWCILTKLMNSLSHNKCWRIPDPMLFLIREANSIMRVASVKSMRLILDKHEVRSLKRITARGWDSCAELYKNKSQLVSQI